MDNTYFIPILLLFLIIYITRQNNMAVMKKLIKKRKTEDKAEMVEIAKTFIGKECIIYTFNSQVTGTVKEVTDGAVLLENGSEREMINFAACDKANDDHHKTTCHKLISADYNRILGL